ncbi:hypothetical protein COCSUDRAFT_54291 [Coccomyxa subellipsoidea C-169]|uniref:Uncharacterized protein n=1 Tax=Coccomyxa subellipsoidea (strain C-169) TaxID=574566 RepID=I0YRC8_COCSC|nr:hypothetical protein COCSUDRAFT_54291 [Coccomyxa subellipsoidea C-169]EIE20947.1 hypothetical protein COCSUDRAFT_54291 [Coccomyxa subellipsoidea C-169]|eukprot:XP_005645491.1 hypothetical protein COCSUDRAFT_54291 [Coccomyxa subellipsoidea C-169]
MGLRVEYYWCCIFLVEDAADALSDKDLDDGGDGGVSDSTSASSAPRCSATRLRPRTRPLSPLSPQRDGALHRQPRRRHQQQQQHSSAGQQWQQPEAGSLAAVKHRGEAAQLQEVRRREHVESGAVGRQWQAGRRCAHHAAREEPGRAGGLAGQAVLHCLQVARRRPQREPAFRQCAVTAARAARSVLRHQRRVALMQVLVGRLLCTAAAYFFFWQT